jgi:sugar/nucleoside kinase (ribokinase family)
VIDVAVIGGPFLDLTFVGLPRMPAAGEEVVARRLGVTPGGTAIQAIGAARLGLAAAVVAPIPSDPFGALLASMLEAEGVRWIGGVGDATSVTALLPDGDGVAMASVLGASEPSRNDVERAGARAVVGSLGRAALVPGDARYYATSGPIEVERGVDRLDERVGRATAVIVNETEARALTGAGGSDAVSAVLALGAPACVVTRGRDGAVAGDAGRIVEIAAPEVEAADATGAGDLFVAAYVWADLAGLPFAARVGWATLAAGLSVRAPTALEGAVTLDELLAEGERGGLKGP